MDISKEKDVLQSVVAIAPYIPLFIDEPVSVAVTNTESFIYNQPCAEIPVKCEIGVPFLPEATPRLVMQSGERTVREVPARVYGVPFMSYAIPLREDGKIVGCLMIAKSVEKIRSVKDSISNLAQEVEQVVAAVNEITEDVQVASASNQQVYSLMDNLLSEVKRMNEILSAINKISNSTKILGLNASIEAARAGAAGKGFSVVAREIERLSDNTTESAHTIGTMLSGIETQVNDMSEKAKEATDAFTQQAASLEEIAATIQNLNADVKIIENYIMQL